jgi:branched-chain amino acid transport system substrate-binding protein
MPRALSLPHLAAALLAAGLAMLGSGCFGPDAPEVRLGFVATFSGEGFRSGRDALEAARFAVETAQRQGRPVIGGQPCRIRLFPRDDKDSPEEAARAVRELAAREHVTAVIGPLASGLADAAALAAEAAGVPLIAPAATATVVTAGRPHIFRIAFTDEFQGVVLGRLAVRELKADRVAVLANRDSLASRSLAEAFIRTATECGGRARLFTYEDRDRDFKPELEKALAEAPDALFLPNPTKEVVLQGLAARKLGFTGLLLGGDTWDGPEIASLPAFHGAVFVDHWREDAPGERSRAYAAAFRRERQRPATELGALTQDAVDVVLTAVARADSVAPEAVTRQLMALPSHDGVTGHFDFVDDGNPSKSLFISRVTDGTTRLETLQMPPPEPCRQASGKAVGE